MSGQLSYILSLENFNQETQTGVSSMVRTQLIYPVYIKAGDHAEPSQKEEVGLKKRPQKESE